MEKVKKDKLVGGEMPGRRGRVGPFRAVVKMPLELHHHTPRTAGKIYFSEATEELPVDEDLEPVEPVVSRRELVLGVLLGLGVSIAVTGLLLIILLT